MLTTLFTRAGERFFKTLAAGRAILTPTRIGFARHTAAIAAAKAAPSTISAAPTVSTSTPSDAFPAQPVAGQVGASAVSTIMATTHKTPSPIAAQLSRHQLLSALELFPAVEVSGRESNAALAVMLQNASNEAGIRLPGDSAPTPGELRQAKLNSILSQPAQPVTAGAWTLESLCALVDSTFGQGSAERVMQRPSEYDVGEGSLSAQLSSQKPGSSDWHETRAKMKSAARQRLLAAESPAAEKGKLDSLREFLCRSGLSVPCLSFSGLPVPKNDSEALTPKQKAIAQTRIDQFCAVLTGDEAAARSPGTAAAAARSHISSQTGRRFVVGAVIASKPADGRFSFSTIPKL